jgi:acyl-CoA synthetase (AMP-forming)/AMP-acid ligase II
VLRGTRLVKRTIGSLVDERVDENGWMHSGDIGFIRADGHLRLTGRSKDMLKIGGENVDPLEVEAYLGTHPAIKAAAVVGVPDARLSEVAVAFLQTMPGQRLTERGMAEHCRGRIASYKIPRHVFLVEEFPMTGSGKVQKSKLRERADDSALASGYLTAGC